MLVAATLAQPVQTHRAFQVSPGLAVVLLIGLIVVGFILWKIRRDD